MEKQKESLAKLSGAHPPGAVGSILPTPFYVFTYLFLTVQVFVAANGLLIVGASFVAEHGL